MNMNVNNQTAQNQVAIDKNKGKNQLDTKKEGQANPVAKSQDSVQLTQQAKKLHNVQNNNNNEVNTVRIETLKAAIINGDYKINAERLAERLSKFEGDFSKYHPTNNN